MNKEKTAAGTIPAAVFLSFFTVQYQGDRTFICQLHVHHRSERSGFNVDPLIHHHLIKGLIQLNSCIRPAAPIKFGRRPLRVSPYNVNWEMDSTCPSTSLRE